MLYRDTLRMHVICTSTSATSAAACTPPQTSGSWHAHSSGIRAEAMDDAPSPIPRPQHAPQVCYNCKVRKRRCTKELPCCGLCSKCVLYVIEFLAPQADLVYDRLLLRCDYGYGASVPPLLKPEPTTIQVSSPGSSTGSNRSVSELQASSHFLASFSPGVQSSPAVGFEGDIAGHVLEILSTHGEDVSSVILNYFRTIDTWLPIISLERIERRLDTLVPHPSVELATLLLCMYLIVRAPDTGRNMQDSTYYDAKFLISMQMSSGKTAIDIVQGGLLLCVYEQCHGMPQAAQITMAGCSTLGLKMMMAERKTGDTGIQNTELGRLWWGIVIIDR